MKESVTIETITPARAEEILVEQERRIAKGEHRNRTISEPTVDRYANDMRHGHWLLNNQGIGFDHMDNLIDGRHRLWAIKKSGVPIRMLVLRGLSPTQNNGITVNTIDTVDCGRNRSIGAQLTIDGVANANVQAAAVRAIARLCADFAPVKMSVTQVRCILEVYGTGIRKTLSNLHSDNRLIRGSIVGMIAMYRAFSQQNADAFAIRYHAMVNLEQGSPIIAIAKFISNNPQAGGANVLQSVRAITLALFHHHHGTKVQSIRSGSSIGTDWIVDNQKSNVRKVREILGLNS